MTWFQNGQTETLISFDLDKRGYYSAHQNASRAKITINLPLEIKALLIVVTAFESQYLRGWMEGDYHVNLAALLKLGTQYQIPDIEAVPDKQSNLQNRVISWTIEQLIKWKRPTLGNKTPAMDETA